MKFECPHCSQHLSAEREMVGRQIGCPACANTITIPAPAVETGSATVPAAPVGVSPPGSFVNREEVFGGTPRAPHRRVPLLALTVAILVVGVAVAAFVIFRGGSGSLNVLSSFTGSPPNELRVYPPNVNLKTKGDRQSVVVQALYADGLTRDVTSDAGFSLVNKALAKIENGTLSPLADGKTDLKIKFGGKEITLPVVVEEAKMERPVSFNLDVMPVFMKAGCNSGGCHGASRGKDGFALSLFGYDSEGDYFRLTRQMIGRRINLALPEESLVMEKAIGKVPHGGGERFKPDSELYRTLVRWIEAGVPKDQTNIAKVVSVDIMPKQAVLDGSNATQRVTVRATYSDGTDRDVTTLAAFFSNNDPVAKVSDDGVVKAGQRGEAFVTARFDTHTVGAQMLVVPRGLKFTWPEVAENNYIDQLVNAKLKKLRITPSDVCDDATFIRRAYIDVTGTLPKPEEVREFVDNMSSGKRGDLIDKLLDRKEFADLWVMKFAELLQIRSNQNEFQYKAALLYYNWLQDQFAKNTPIDQIVKGILTAEGSNFKNPAASYFQIERDTLKTSENVAQVFMGMRVQCAQCHNHPFDQWTMNDYYSFAAFFPQVTRKQGDDPRETIIYAKADGEVQHPVTKKPMAPKFLGGERPEIKKGEDRREVLANWLASTNNPFFAKNMANIVWAHFLGKGIIDPVDDVRVSNPSINPELLDALGTKFMDYKYDFKKLVRDICNSRTYQLSTRANESNALDDRNFSHASIRRMRAEVLLDCINGVTDTADKFQGLPRGARAVEIADGNVNNYFLTTFGRATRGTVCSCEVRTEPNLSQALHLLNGDSTQGKIANGGVVKKLLAAHKEPAKVIEELYLRCLSRAPTEKEMARLKTHFV
ncbi:MAG TPA: DUF1549 domain-containing protein, partial [Candidatus Limnocylindria bacterium]|nr:DUF1549 domain-containing protein [Candidatus Limnocylindria bacterium]